MAASSIKLVTRVAALLLLGFENSGDPPGLHGQGGSHRNQSWPIIFVSTVDLLGGDVCPVNVLAVDSQAKGEKGGADDDFAVGAPQSTALYLLPGTKRKESNCWDGERITMVRRLAIAYAASNDCANGADIHGAWLVFLPLVMRSLVCLSHPGVHILFRTSQANIRSRSSPWTDCHNAWDLAWNDIISEIYLEWHKTSLLWFKWENE